MLFYQLLICISITVNEVLFFFQLLNHGITQSVPSAGFRFYVPSL
ncbi:hypothetical protein [Bacillus thuringiensis]